MLDTCDLCKEQREVQDYIEPVPTSGFYHTQRLCEECADTCTYCNGSFKADECVCDEED